MSLPRFYLPAPLQAGDLQLPEATAHYMCRVLRLDSDAQVLLFDGQGEQWLARLTRVEKKKVTVNLLHRVAAQPRSSLQTHLGQALSKGERMDWAIQKATELGVSQITPLVTEHCEVRLNQERASKRLQHWQQIAISACEQCGRADVPLIHPVSTLQTWLQQVQADLKLLLHPQAQGFARYQRPGSLALLIGPEGGLSNNDLQQARQHGFDGVSLGPRILRTETAPVAALAISQFLWGDFGYNAGPST